MTRSSPSRHPAPRRPSVGAGVHLCLAALAAAILLAGTVPVKGRARDASPVADTAAPPVKAVAAVPAALAAQTDMLASVVARRYKVAQDAATEVVRSAMREGAAHGLDPVLILAVIAVESRFNPFAASEQGALGLMQIVPRFHMDKMPERGVPAILAPDANIALGTRILKDSIRRGGSDEVGLQLYNGAFDDETRAYANRVLSERRKLEQSLPKPRA
jgi:soluble lytic murein transglycosylase-like protein